MIFVLWVLLAFGLGLVAKGRGDSFWVWFVLALVIDPLLAGIIYVIVRK